MNEKVKYWVEISDYDLETAQAMLDSKRFLYVGFMCHQSIEKILKAMFVFTFKETPPYIHNLAILAKKINTEEWIEPQFIDLIDNLDPLNIESRYPSYKEQLSKSLTIEKCNYLINRTREFQAWIKMKLLQK